MPMCVSSAYMMMDSFFQLEEETKVGEAAAEFVELLLKEGGRLVSVREFFDDDDLKMKTCAKFEYTT